MNLHEYQAKEMLRNAYIKVPNGTLIYSAEEADSFVRLSKVNKFAIKVQIHSGGRGLSGGVKIINTPEEAKEFAEKLLGKNLVTYQNKPHGQPVHQILIEETVSIKQELYFSILIDRQTEKVTIICSSAGGMEIEEISKKNPELIFTLPCIINSTPDLNALNNLLSAFSFNDKVVIQFKNLLSASYKLFIDNDLSLLEINPLVISSDDELIALDCKISVDDNALFKHLEMNKLHDWSQVDSKEADAHHAGLNYIALD